MPGQELSPTKSYFIEILLCPRRRPVYCHVVVVMPRRDRSIDPGLQAFGDWRGLHRASVVNKHHLSQQRHLRSNGKLRQVGVEFGIGSRDQITLHLRVLENSRESGNNPESLSGLVEGAQTHKTATALRHV